VDINKYAVDESIRKGIDARLGDVLEIQKVFDGRKFDVIIAGDIIEHIFDTDFFLENIKLSLNENGMLLLSTPNIVSLGRRLMAVFGVNPYCEYSAEANGINVGHIRYYSIKNLKDQFFKKGLIIKSLETDTVNLPVNILNYYMSKYFPGLGREILVAAILK
jgi:SAM-dependent methyltransferase